MLRPRPHKGRFSTVGFLTDPNNAEFWLLLAVVVFVVILVRVRVPSLVTKALDDAGAKVQAQLDEAQRLRKEAETLLADVKVQRAETERAAEDMMRSARSAAERLRAEAAVKLEEDVKRRAVLAERKIALAESQAANDVKAAAVEMAARASESVLAARLANAGGADPSIDAALSQLGTRFNAGRANA
jgi:F-type H+-transporting ATPase subunit b